MSSASASNPYQTAGIILAVTPLLFGFVVYAIVATLIGEEHLEGTTLGMIMLFLPNVVGVFLLVFGRYLPAAAAGPIGLRAVGLVLVATALVGAVVTGTPGDAAIGLGIVLIVGVGLVALSFVIRGPDPST